MFQNIRGRRVYVIDISQEDPKTLLPIRTNFVPAQTDSAIGRIFAYPLGLGYSPSSLEPYAKALDHAIRQEIITGPGKYAIEVDKMTGNWGIFAVTE